VEKTLVKKTRRPRGSGAPKIVATHITAAEFYERHRYCVNIEDIYSMSARSKYMPGGKAVCDHEEDGYCFHNEPNAEILEKINARLGGKPVVEEKPKRKRGEKKEIIPNYFCLKCSNRHSEAPNILNEYTDHMKYKRGRGRPKRAEG
jgi:hypothetical protein